MPFVSTLIAVYDHMINGCTFIRVTLCLIVDMLFTAAFSEIPLRVTCNRCLLDRRAIASCPSAVRLPEKRYAYARETGALRTHNAVHVTQLPWFTVHAGTILRICVATRALREGSALRRLRISFLNKTRWLPSWSFSDRAKDGSSETARSHRSLRCSAAACSGKTY